MTNSLIPIFSLAVALFAGPQDAPPVLEREEVTAPLAPLSMSAEALCLRGDHFLDDASRAAVTQARGLYETAISAYPKAVCGHAGLARALVAVYQRRIEQDDTLIDESIEEARQAILLDPKSSVAHAALAGALLADLRAGEATGSAEMALSLAPDSIPAQQTAALVRLANGDLEGARAVIERALKLRPDLPVSHHTLGNVQLLSGQKVEAIDSYRNALSLSPDFVPSILQVAAAYEALGNYIAAGQIFQDVIHDHPEEASRAYLYMGHSLMKRNSWNAALGAFSHVDFKTRKGLSNGTALYLKALCYEQLGRTEEARAAFREVIDSWPDATGGLATSERLSFPAYEGLGRLHLTARDTEQAQTVMEEGIARSGASLDLYLRLAGLYQDYRMPDRAAALLEKAVARDLMPKSAGKLLSAYTIGIRLAKESGDTARVDRFVTALDAQSTRLVALHDYVRDLEAMRAYSIAGRGDRALEVLRRGLDAGYVRLEWLANDPDLETLRATAAFKELARSRPAGARPSH